MRLRLGIDVACKAAHQVSCTDETGNFLFAGRRFRSTIDDLDKLWASLPDAEEVLVVLEPTRNAWVLLAAWLRSRGARVVLVPPEQSADLRDYYHKHTKNDRLDSRVLARLPLLHPEGLRTLGDGELGPADPLRRATRRRRSLVKRRTATYARIDALLELLGPQWADALGSGEYAKTALTVLEHTGGDPHAIKRLGRKRLSALLIRTSRGAWRETHAEVVWHAAELTLKLWEAGGLDFTELAQDLAGEARLALQLNTEIDALDDRISVLYDDADPTAILTTVPGLGVTSAAVILAGLGDPDRFSTLAGIRAFTGLIPKLDESGTSSRHGPPTKAGDPALREALFNAADRARKIDPTLAARYQRLIQAGKHHNSALCTLAAVLVTRLAACWRTRTPYQLQDVDGQPLAEAEGRAICVTRYQVTDADRAKNRSQRTAHHQKQTGRRKKESQSAPAAGPSTNHTNHHEAA
ncbi:IS110 family transposase [Paractinoplanes atraurantiacus]|uniref:Transposase n=1 Tax=Paractinoplanes atraurantiacus TaxID=1036182 RepID=A0A285K2P9_9ACTN|nr:IS110 family transposase [Actinoplanes atraurantiacus]SNY66808.1 Transposase [Actinoplanes atraurantiacus]